MEQHQLSLSSHGPSPPTPHPPRHGFQNYGSIPRRGGRNATSVGHIAMAEQRLSEFFEPSRPSSTVVYTDAELQQIAELLKSMGRPAWSTVPRIYTVLRTINQLEQLDVFIQQGITDIWFPFSSSSLPGQLSP